LGDLGRPAHLLSQGKAPINTLHDGEDQAAQSLPKGTPCRLLENGITFWMIINHIVDDYQEFLG
jgi:hypothetical protein